MKTPSSHRLLMAAFIAACASTSHAKTNLWQDISQQNVQSRGSTTNRLLKLDEAQLEQLILQHFQQRGSAAHSSLNLTVPLPDGSNANIELETSTVLSEELQQRYPDMKTWRVSSQHPGIISGRAEFTELGFHIMLRSQDGDQWLIEPEEVQTNAALRQYHSYSRRYHSTPQTQVFSCGVTAQQNAPFHWQQNYGRNDQLNRQNDAQRTEKFMLSYDLAIAATGEYTGQFSGSQSAAYSNIVTTVNRINEIYERDLGITLKLVSGTETVFTNPASDPFDNPSALLTSYQNQNVLDTTIGANRYDIGHVLNGATSGDGIALVGSACLNGKKAQGYTASDRPASTSFMIDYVAHEIGHQLGATHTFNSTLSGCGGGGRISATAFEPGSGSTVMSYAGLCASDNIQMTSDPQFHSGSIDQIYRLTNSGSAALCASRISQDNSPPIVTAGADHTIPARTPFILSGTATDQDGDRLLFGWDQIDLGTPSRIGTDTANNPLIKSAPLSDSGIRNVPDITRLLSTTQATSSGESLPRSNRTLNFRLNVRDGKGAGSNDTVRLTVHDTGERFSISKPATTLNAGEHQILWNTAGTEQPPINCSHVDITYTNNRGISFTNIKLQTPNDGAENIQLTSQAQHIRVKCSNNIFFALSGTAPHIASYQNDSSQSSGTNTDTGDNTDNPGGGGSIPMNIACLLFLTVLFSMLNRFRDLRG